MFGYNVKKFIINWVIVLLILVIGASFALGYNSLTGAMDPIAGFNALSSLFGGLPSLGGLLAVMVALAGVAYLLYYMTKTNYETRKGAQWLHIGIIVAVLLMALFVGVGWIDISDDFWPTIGTIVGVVVIVTAATAVVTHRTQRVVKSPSRP